MWLFSANCGGGVNDVAAPSSKSKMQLVGQQNKYFNILMKETCFFLRPTIFNILRKII